MMGWDIAIAPMAGWPVLVLAAIVSLILIGLQAWTGMRGWWLRGIAFALLFAALLDPSIRKEERESLTDIAVLVVDRSLSQEVGGRLRQTDAAALSLKEQAARLANTELRVAEVRSGITADDDGTRAFEALTRVLADIPPERFAGVVMLTDGQIHDVPADLAKSEIAGPVHGLITGSRSERDRKIVIDAAPRFGIVGKEQTIRFHVEEVNGGTGSVDVSIAAGKDDPITLTVIPSQPVEVPLT
ncbi:MAG: hypothetical protein ACREDU_00120, partial [Methylocella sp.]